MFITLTQLHDEEAALIKPVIPNKDGGLHVALLSLNYVIGYHNIKTKLAITMITTRDFERGPEREHYLIRPRFYSIKELIQTIKNTVPGISIRLAEETSKVTLTVREIMMR